jgi:hypothetical protein
MFLPVLLPLLINGVDVELHGVLIFAGAKVMFGRVVLVSVGSLYVLGGAAGAKRVLEEE